MSFSLPDWPPCSPEIAQSIISCVKNGDWGRYQSQVKRRLSAQIAKGFGVNYVRLTSSGTSAIDLALRAARVSTRDAVILCGFDYPGNFRSIELLGATPVLVDASPEQFAPSVQTIQQAIDALQVEPKIRAVILSHLYGRASDIKSIRAFCDERSWVLIEDACQVPGMSIDSSPAGSLGHIGTLSFGGSKPLTAGNGGAILTNDSTLSARIAAYVDRPSDTYAMSPLQAAAIIPQLATLHSYNQHRATTAKRIALRLNSSQIRVLIEDRKGVETAYYKLAIELSSKADREGVLAKAASLNLPIGESFRSMGKASSRRCQKPVSLPRSQELADRLVLLDHRALLVDDDNLDVLIDRIDETFKTV